MQSMKSVKSEPQRIAPSRQVATTLLQSCSGRFADENVVKSSLSLRDQTTDCYKRSKDATACVPLDHENDADPLCKEAWKMSILQPLGGPARNVGLIRLINDEARKTHMQRSSYTARLADVEMKLSPKELLAEVCTDVRLAVRRCLNVYKPIRFMYVESQRTCQRRLEIRQGVRAIMPRIRIKVLFIGMLLKAAQQEEDPAELMWRSLSESVAAKPDPARIRKFFEEGPVSCVEVEDEHSMQEGASAVAAVTDNDGEGDLDDGMRRCHSAPASELFLHKNRPALPRLPLPLPMQRL
jgi:hypothetical protein